jgi:hypothetical protein
MITTQFLGGLGNNLFQLANLYNQHIKHVTDYFIPKTVMRGDIGKYGQSTILEFDRLFENEFNYIDNTNTKYKKYQHHDMVPSDTNFRYSEVPFVNGIIYRGYFQSDKYFKDFNLKDTFILNREIKEKLYKKYFELFNKKTLAVHYRLGGDRVEQHMQVFHPTVTVNYYEESIKEIVNGAPTDYNILVFSDKIDSAMSKLSPLGYNFIPIINSDNIEDFIMMTMTNDIIIGNSTFSWWSAYLNNNNGTVIAPRTQWFGKGYNHFDLSDAFPENWVTK